MDTQKIRHFLALAELKHFGKASQQCFVSTSTLSRSIKSLEEELNTSLFKRDNRSVELTDAGTKLVAVARQLMQQWEGFTELVQTKAQTLSGKLSIYCSVTASYSFLHDILSEFRMHHPDIIIKLHTGDSALAIDRVRSGAEDIAIAAKPDNLAKTFSFKRITDSPLQLICSKHKKFSKAGNNQKHLLESEPLILAERGLARERLNTWFKKHRIKPNIYAEVSGHEAIVSMVSLGFGIGLAPEIVIKNSPLSNSVKPFIYQADLKPYEVGFCVLEKKLSQPIIKAFWEQLTFNA